MTKPEFVDMVNKLQQNSVQLDKVENALGFSITSIGVIGQLMNLSFTLLLMNLNINEYKEHNKITELSRLIYISGSKEEVENFYDRYYKGE